MESTHQVHEEPKTKGAAVSALAIVGFIALILFGMGLAIYAARSLPTALSTVGEAAASLSGVFQQDNPPRVDVVNETPTYPTNPTVVTLPLDTPVVENGAPAPVAPQPTYTPPTQPTRPAASYPPPSPTYRVVTVGGAQSFNYYGDPDLTVEIIRIGYLRRSGDTDTFVESRSVPKGKDGAVQFRISNKGTNESGKFDLSIKVRTSSGTDTDTVAAPSMRPNTSLTSFGYFDANRSGTVDITLEVDPKDRVDESNERNNDDSEDISVRN